MRVSAALRSELAARRAEEQTLWAKVPKDVSAPTAESKSVAARWSDELGPVGADNIPPKVREWLLGNAMGDEASVRDLHRLSSDLRQSARNARKGENTNLTLAKIADEVADAIMVDIEGAANPSVAPALVDAVSYSRALHKTFDVGDVGRLLQRRAAGDATIPPEAALPKTVGRGGPEGMVARRDIIAAAPSAEDDISDFLRGRFIDAVQTPEGKFSPRTAATWMRNNREILAQNPKLEAELRKALANRESAAAFEVATQARMKLTEQGAISKFAGSQNEKAVLTILSADVPAKSARSLANAARRDDTGKALAGLKGAFTDYLMGTAIESGGALNAGKLKLLLSNKRTLAALQQVFSAEELGRMQRIAKELAKLETAEASASLGAVIETPANKMIEMATRIFAAKTASRINRATSGKSDPGVSLQIASMASGRAKEFMKRLTNVQARKMLMDAIEDPELFKALLMEPGRVNIPLKYRNKLAPYFVGAASNTGDEK
jgi:hypothetical protein